MNNELIPPELVAARLAAAENLEDRCLAELIQGEPRFPEVLWYVQWRSFQPGGLSKLADELLDGFSLVTQFRRLPAPSGRGVKWTLAECLEAWSWADREHLDWLDHGTAGFPGGQRYTFAEWRESFFASDLTEEASQRGSGCNRAMLLEGLSKFNVEFFSARAAIAAAEGLPLYLRDLCTRPGCWP